ncbi:MAG TPA: prepilin-type N-terminal cleavage/methylation domain-containing protein [Gemmatimonadaceae bacterium]|nr:prepilin-type N-terminal cleavage/methylation domain-containing protein [Gemmatimonadaceae bacterium]
MHARSGRARRGFTLAEMLVAMALMGVLLGISTQLFRKQSSAVSTQAGRLDAQQNSRFALSSLDRELRVAGVGVVDAQPMIVEAGPLSITFNGDLVAQDTSDLGAVYINPDVDSAAAGAMKPSEKLTLPGTSTQYPDTLYMQNAGVPSLAETISYWLSRDSTASRTNEYILFRRVNGRPAKMVARGIVYNSSDTVFQYYKGDTTGALTRISPAVLPLVHTAAIHGAPNDTGRSALTDSIRQVKVQFTSVFHDPRTGQDTYRRLQTTIHIMNAGLIHHSTCGQPPLGVTPTVTVTPADGITVFQTYVTVSWSPSVDDGAGEKDVERYAIYRRLSSDPAFDQPIASAPAGLDSNSTSYSFKDTDVLSGQSWIYGVAAQDCTPSSSPIGTASAVTIP